MRVENGLSGQANTVEIIGESRDSFMASRSYRNIIAALSLCESCALSLRESNETEPAPNTLITDMAKNLEQAAQEARKLWPVAITNREADKITQAMRKADFQNPFLDSSQTECTIYYTSLALGLLEELFSLKQSKIPFTTRTTHPGLSDQASGCADG